MFKSSAKKVMGTLSLLASKNTVHMHARQLVLRGIWPLLDLKMTGWICRRPEWIRSYNLRSMAKIETSRPTQGTSDNMGRLAAYFKSGIVREDNLVDGDSIWGDYRETLYRPMFEAFENGTESEFMARVFRSSAVNGYSYGTTFDAMPHRWQYLPIHIELSIVQLAEYLGVVRAECADQGKHAAWRSLKTPEQVVSGIEAVLGFSMEHPRLGDPRGILFGGRFITRETGSQIYTALRIAESIKDCLPEKLSILEIGGGYGGLCYWLHKVLGHRIEDYYLVDIPEACMVQGFFLGQEFNVTLPNEKQKKSSVNIGHHTDLDRISNKPNLIINQDSMPEMGEVEAERYVKWISENCEGVFLSFNQEAYSLNGSTGELQASVPEIVARYPNVVRRDRRYSWDRRGYVEETYLVNLE